MAQNFWTLSNIGFEEGFCVNDFVVTKSNNFYAIGAKVTTTPTYKSNSAIYRSFDNGISWELIDTVFLSKNYNVGGERICAVGDTLLIYLYPWQYRSNNNGKSWSEVYVDDYNSFRDFVATKKNKLFSSVEWNQCCPTHNRPQIRWSETIGSSWASISTIGLSTTEYWTNYNAMCAVGDTLLLSVSEDDRSVYTISKSIDVGATWTQSDLGIEQGFKASGFAVTETNVVYAIGIKNSSPAIYKSSDTGNTWEKVDTTGLADYNDTFNGIGAVGNTILLSARSKSKGNAVFRFQDRTSINDLMKADDFKVYPNPFNYFITIKNNSPSSQKIKGIEILSINGAILKCFNSNFDQLNITDLTPGIYFLKVNADNKSHLIKVVKMNR